MHEVLPDSLSFLLRATHVVLVRIEAAKTGDWAPGAAGVTRVVAVEAKLEALFKGKLSEPAGSVVRVALTQFGTGTSRVAGVPGAWSHQRVEPGARFVVLSVTSSESAPEILRDPAALLVLPADEALTDVELAATAESRSLDVGATVALATPAAPRLGALFAEYLWARFGAAALAEEKKLEPIAALLEQPALGRGARVTLVSTLVSAITSPEPPPPRQSARLAVALFRLLGMPEAAPLHDNLVGTYLPTLLDLAEPHARRAADVFHDHPGELARARAAAHAYKGSEPAAPLIGWLDR